MKKIITLITFVALSLTLTACDGGRYEGLRLWEPGSPDHEAICGIHDWKEDEVLLVEEIPADVWDKSEWSWVPREGCPQ